jgi:hypothetical protein
MLGVLVQPAPQPKGHTAEEQQDQRQAVECGFRIDAARHSEEFPPGIPN